ncbi:hypothetical protein F3N42_09530 [Marinihelvus fidelis]|uniref:Uncharacterized protein n=1 Tax=Marinihelvus fidelis TaxID=2613842 RepID=A0A5N0TBT9_9GAMM|nr:hypothetical protein [Marinihelvus fidelis]KAA9131547.1 hypothetical protein F3N42_09530 [Marinihelvus fidelis]
MQATKTLLFYAAVITTLATLGYAFWLDTRPQAPEPEPNHSKATTAPPTPSHQPPPIAAPSPSPARKTLRKCTGDHGEPVFTVTDDPNCKPYTSGNTLSVIEQMPRNSWLEQKRRAEQAQAENRRTNTPRKYNPDIRLTGKSPPRGTTRECKFPIGRALEVERMLSAADDASESAWLDEYCEWVSEASGLQCPDLASTLYYEKLCYFK